VLEGGTESDLLQRRCERRRKEGDLDRGKKGEPNSEGGGGKRRKTLREKRQGGMTTARTPVWEGVGYRPRLSSTLLKAGKGGTPIMGEKRP